MNNDTATDVVARVIQRLYDNATEVVLDREVASEIVKALRDVGWASLNDVARLIEAAGGEIVVPGEILGDNRERRVTKQDDFGSGGVKFRVSIATA